MAEASPSVASRITLTDKRALDPNSVAGKALKNNLAVLTKLGGSGELPRPDISVFNVPAELNNPNTIFLVGSPAGNGQGIQHTDAEPHLDNVSFKECAFYSLCYHTPPESGVMMTYSPSACGRGMEYWTLLGEKEGRAMVVLPAWFALYRPSFGFSDSLKRLAEVPDTAVAMYVPPLWL